MFFFSKNLGDNLNYILLQKMIRHKTYFYNIIKRENKKIGFDKNIQKLNEIAKTDLFFIGSILETLSNWTYVFKNKETKDKSLISKYYFKIYDFFHPLIIFGSGFMNNLTKNESYVRKIKILSVRGNLTLKRLVKNGIKVSNSVVLADPGILFPLIIENNKRNSTKKIYNLCIIPHYIDQNNKLVKINIKVKNTLILDIRSNPDKFISSLLKCKRVLSSSLHGLIISDSLGIPNMRMILSDKINGGDFKFKDYYSAYGLELPKYIDLRKTTFNENELHELDFRYNIPMDMIIKKQCQLLNNFPFKLNKYFKYKQISCKKIIS